MLASLIRIFSTERNLREFLQSAQLNNKADEAKTFYIPFAVKRFNLTEVEKENTFCFCGGLESEYRAFQVFEALSTIPDIKISWLVNGHEEPQAQSFLKENNFNFVQEYDEVYETDNLIINYSVVIRDDSGNGIAFITKIQSK